ncbi:MAG: DNA helicase RecQ [Planctomycetota bacterium]|jgi:ATP-dependent DNA helicase RecQ|nr:DNA helicase RecQ [Planctomycetota bacterium]
MDLDDYWEQEGDEVLPDVSDLEPVRPAVATAPREELQPEQALKRYWGYDSFRALQREAIDAALAGQDALVILPTGGGKSLCYQVPSACRQGLVLVISPLIALMDDQVASACSAGLRAGALHSARGDGRATYAAALNGQLDLLYVSPERLCVGDLLQQLAPHLRLAAVDEAHCISHWGHDFRPEYRQLGQMLGQLQGVPRMALTATATPQVQDDIVSQLGLRDAQRLVGHPDRPNLIYRCLSRQDQTKQILEVIKRHPGEGGIVYAQTRKTTERIATALRKAKVDAAAYHAGMNPTEREAVQSSFVNEQLDVVVATVAFGMGIDRSNVRYVVHANTPRSIEHFQQESGRAGRDGLPADCVLLFSGGDLALHRQLALKDGALSGERQQALDRQLAEVGRFAMAPVCRHRLLTDHFGQSYDSKDGGCGACDVCLGETTELPADEALLTAQKIISAVWRTESRFGIGYVVDILMGRGGERVKRNRHDQLALFGLLRDSGDAAIRAWIDQLIVQELLQLYERERFTMLALTDAGMALCKGEGSVRLGEPVAPSSKKSSRKRQDDAAWDGVDRELFESLRAVRRAIAETQGVPPYVVFGDTALREMAANKPSDETAFLAIKGVGESKMARYGQAFLAAINGTEAAAAAALAQR